MGEGPHGSSDPRGVRTPPHRHLPRAAAEPPVRIRTEGLPAHVAERLHEKARLGMTELVHYVNRTRMMGHQVRLADLLADEPERRRPSRRVPVEAIPRSR